MLTMHQIRVEALMAEIRDRLNDSVREGYGDTNVDLIVVDVISGEAPALADEVLARLSV